MADREALHKRLLATFKVEAREHTAALSGILLDLERAEPGSSSALIEVGFREVHSLKGAARSVGLGDVETVCQSLENVFAALKRGTLPISAGLFDVLLRSVKIIEQLLTELETGRTDHLLALEPLLDSLSGALSGARGADRARTPVVERGLVESPQPGTQAQPTQVQAASRPSSPPAQAPQSASPQPAPPRSVPPRPEGSEDPTHAANRGMPAQAPGADLSSAEPAPAQHASTALANLAHVPSMQAALTEASFGRGAAPSIPPSQSIAASVTETVRVPTHRLDAVRLSAEELLVDRLSLAEQTRELERIGQRVRAFRRQSARMLINLKSARVAALSANSAKLHQERFQHSLDELLEFHRSALEELEHGVSQLNAASARTSFGLTNKTASLINQSRELLVLPCAWLLEPLRQVVRDLARDLGKSVSLEFRGEGLEMDRRILASLRDPFLHMLRNCIDHGVESPSERERLGKPKSACILVEVGRVRAGRVDISLADDGRGIDPDRVKEAALSAGISSPAELERMDREGILNLVFRSSLSTSPLITDLSGRGLGLAIVRDHVEKLGGKVRIESELGRGTRFILTLPLSLATLRGLIVRVSDQLFAIPTLSVSCVIRVTKDRVQTFENRPAVSVEGKPLALISLAGLFGTRSPELEVVHAVVVSANGVRMAFRVDEIRDEQDLPVKPLGSELSKMALVMGVTVLGTGELAPILDPAELVQRAIHALDADATRGAEAPLDPERRRSILVAEDSITSRTLLKGILEGAGFSVTTAVDGADAWAKLRLESFDLVVSDVDMPRLNGFGLTEKIRADKKLSELPVILVTSLESREDRERGVEVGASAYIVKRSFEQSNLLEVVSRLI